MVILIGNTAIITFMREHFNIIIFSVDLVFVNILKQILGEIDKKFQISVYQLFSEAQNFPENKSVDLILVDDLIIGTPSYELISFLRLNRKILCPLIYFGINEHNGERKALLSGANYFINKPFNPDNVLRVIQDGLENKHQ